MVNHSRQESMQHATLESSDSGVAFFSESSCDTARYHCDECDYKTDDYHDYKDHDCEKES